MHDEIPDRPVSEKRPDLMIRLTRSALLPQLGDTTRKQISSTFTLVEEEVVRIFDEAGGATESSLGTVLSSVLYTVVDGAVVEALQYTVIVGTG